MFQFIISTCLTLVIIGAASSTEQYLRSVRSMSTDCITPIEHNAMLSLNVEWNQLAINSSFLVNITCLTNKISVYRKPCFWVDATTWLSINDSLGYMVTASHPVKGELNRVDFQTPQNVSNSHLKNVIRPGVYNITVEGHCAMDVKGHSSVFRYVNDKNQKKQVFISHDRDGGVEWIFPLWSDQTMKAKFTISMEHDEDYKAVSHMSSHTVSKNGRIITIFPTTPELLIHLISVALVPKDFIEIYDENSPSPRRTSLWCRQEIRKSMTYVMYILDKVTHKFDCLKRDKNNTCLSLTKYIPYSYSWNVSSVQYVIVPNYDERIVITPGLVFLRELDYMYDEQVSLPMPKIQVKLTAAANAIYFIFVEHFAVDQQKDTDIYLFEVYMNYFAFTVLHQSGYNRSDPVESALSMDSYVIQNQWYLRYIEAINRKRMRNEIMDHDFSSLNSLTVLRGLRMIDLLMNKSPGHILENSMKFLSTGQAEIISDAISFIISNITLNQKYDVFMDHIIRDKRFPLERWVAQEYFELDVERFYYPGFAELIIKNCASRKETDQCTNSYLPVKYTYVHQQIGARTRIKTDVVWITDNRPNVNFINRPAYIPETAYLIVNVQQTGFYRVNYDLENWKRLGRYLNSTLRDPVTYAQILDDAFYFLVRQTNSFSIMDIFFELASNLQRESDYALWYPMMNALEYLSRYFPLSKYISNKVYKILNEFLKTTLYTKEISSMKNDTFGYNVQYDVLKWACVFKDLNCQEYIKAVMKWHIEDPTENKLKAGWKEWFYCQGLQMENISYESSKIWSLLYRENDWLTTKHLEYLTCSTNEKNIIYSLCLIKQQISITLNPLEYSPSNGNKKILNDFIFRLVKHSDTNSVLELVLNYMKTIKTRVERPLAVLTVMINNIYSPESRRVVSLANANEQFMKNVERFINSIQNDDIDLNTKYKKKPIVDAVIKKLNDRFLFKWKIVWR